MQKSEQQGRNEYVIDYDERNPFSLDCEQLKPIYKGSAFAKCSFCASCFQPSSKGKVCVICDTCAVGVDTVGLVTQSAASRTK